MVQIEFINLLINRRSLDRVYRARLKCYEGRGQSVAQGCCNHDFGSPTRMQGRRKNAAACGSAGTGPLCPTAVGQSLECLLEKSLHPSGDNVFLKKLFSIDPALLKVGQVVVNVATIAITNALARVAVGFQSHDGCAPWKCCVPNR
jgi:hypothetical protein